MNCTRSRAVRARRVVIALIAACAIIVAVAPLWLAMIGRWLAMPSYPRHTEAIVVTGGSLARTDYGIALYQRSLAPELWHTGYASDEQLTTTVVAQGHVPRTVFHYLTTTSTWSDGTQITAAIRTRKLRSILVVTDWWHSRRAICALSAQLDGYEVTMSYAAAPAPVDPENWWRDDVIRAKVMHELGGIVVYGLRYGMLPWDCL